MISEWITSVQNARIKNIQKLRIKAHERKAQALFVIEGIREIMLALSENYVVDSFYICPSLLSGTDAFVMIYPIYRKVPCYQVNEIVFRKIACRDNSNGIVALAKPKSHSLTDLHLSGNPLILILESIEKPGNLGAILRTADAAGIDAIIICDGQTDLYNANVIRSSVGCVFTVPIAIGTQQEIFSYLKRKHIRITATFLPSSVCYQEVSFTSASAIIMGTETSGLSDFWIENADQCIKIPMFGKTDSLNVSVATAIIIFEAVRQRSFSFSH